MKPFSLLVKPASADCNLRCHYCFYLDRCELYPQESRHRMSAEVLEKIIRTFMQTQQSQYAFGWQGGEPTLMGLDFFKKVIELQKRYGRSGVSVSNGLQTNGTLITDEFARHLADYHFLVGISLDGPRRIHDEQRTYLDGRGSHADVMRGIDALKRHEVDFNILTLVNRVNVTKARAVYRYLCERGFMFHQYIECVEFDERGALLPFAVRGEEWGEFLCTIYDEWIKNDTRKVSVRLFDSVLGKMVEGRPNVCHMDNNCSQYLVVEYNGDVYPCDFFVEPGLKLGNITENSWGELLDSSLRREFAARKSQWSEECGTCPFVAYCAGDCPKNRPFKGKDPRALSSLCKGWKMFYEHSLDGFRKLADEVIAERIGNSEMNLLPALRSLTAVQFKDY